MSALIIRALLAITLGLCPVLASAQGLRVVARVNDEAITDFELGQRVILAIRSTNQTDSPDLRKRLAPQILRQMIDERLQIQDAKRFGMKPTEAEVNGRIADIERTAGLAPGQFKLYLKGIGVPYEIAAAQIESTIAWLKLVRRRIRPQVDISESEVDDAMARMRANVGKTESHVGEIFIPIDRADQADEGRRSAERIVEQARRGTPFPALAQQFSQGATAQNGGDLGWVLPGSLDPALDSAIDKLPLRQASEPIRTTSGWHILYVAERRPFASSRPEDARLNLVQMTLALPVNASPSEVDQATAEARKVMGNVHQCADLHVQSRQTKGATSGDLKNVRAGDLASNRQMFEEIPKLAPGGVAGPFRVAEGLQVVSLCSKQGTDGLPTRDSISQQLLLQKLDAVGRRYMRDLRRAATIDIKP
ncbi:MAG: peptidylprolyl isomerase [Proteobacteria bacterium]|nr:peptidylprolyl isomerase [Pseudomonadota bacterium]